MRLLINLLFFIYTMFISEQSFRNTLLGPGFQWGVGPSSHIKTPALIFSNANINTPVFKLIGCMHQDITVLSCKKFITGKRILIFFYIWKRELRKNRTLNTLLKPLAPRK